jgi:elongation factor Ts
MPVGTEQIKELRDRTGVSVMECKKALEEADGDMDKALVILRKKSGDTAAKKSDRTLGAGTVAAYIHASKDVGAMVALSCETDFVAKNPEFAELAYQIAMHAAATNPLFISSDQVTDEDLKAAREVFEKEAADKPDAIRDKVVQGKLDAYAQERVLLEQDFVKDPSVKIKSLIEQATQKFGERVVVTECVRMSTRA